MYAVITIISITPLITTLDNTEYETLNNTYGTANVINIYFVNGISFYGSSANGVAPTPGGSHWVILRNNADTTVYPHEMGHFLDCCIHMAIQILLKQMSLWMVLIVMKQVIIFVIHLPIRGLVLLL
jgi:hypothetical protein